MSERGFTTRQLHGGVERDAAHNPRQVPLYLTAGFVFDDFDQARDRFAAVDEGYSYTRMGNPTNASLERRIADLEGGVEALFVSSGQAAVSIALLGLVRSGDHIVAAGNTYEGSRWLLLDNFAQIGVDVSFVVGNDPAEWEAAIRPNTRAVFAESIANPRNEILDIEAIAAVTKRHGIPLVVDNTLATPYLLRPLEHGADVVVHSASKFLAGHGNVLGGVIVDGGAFDWSEHTRLRSVSPDGGPSYVERFGARAYIRYLRENVAPRYGSVASPFNAFLIQQGIETLSLRVQRQSASSLQIARWLEQQPEVASVDYSGLESSDYHALAQRYLPRGAGSVFSFTLRGGEPAARALHDAVVLFTRMTNLGDVRSLIIHPGSTTHTLRTKADLEQAGILPGLIRLSVGIEDVDDLLADLEQALAAVRASTKHSATGRNTATTVGILSAS